MKTPPAFLLSRLVACLLALTAAASAQTYNVIDLGPLAGAPTFATSINDNGTISGYSQPDPSSARAWIWKEGAGLLDVGSFGGADNRAFALGSDDTLFGYSQDGAGVPRGFSWDGAALADLGSLAPGDAVFPQAVNGDGTAVGYTNTAGTTLGFKISAGAMTALGTLAGSPAPATSAAYDINDAGRIVGVANWVAGGTCAFRTDAGGTLVSLGTLGANDSFAYAINAGGDVVGDSVNALNETHAFLFTDAGGIRDLGVITGGHESHALGIDDAGDVVGSAEDSAGNSRAFLWQPGSANLRDLNDLIPPTSGWALEEARDINNGGDIVGVGTVGGQQHAFLLERSSGADTFAPVAVATVTPPSQGSSVTQVAVKYWDNEKVVTATAHAAGAIRITGPNFYDMPGTAFSWTTNDSQVVNASFNVPAPGGIWDPTDNGTYEVRVAANQVSDLAGNKHPGGVIASFTVGLQTAPTFNISGLAASATLGTAVSLNVSAASSFPSAPGDIFTYTIDWDGDGVDVQTVSGPSGLAIPHTYTSLGTHTVRAHCTDPHSAVSGDRTATVTITNAAAPVISELLAATTGYFNSMHGVVAAVKSGRIYMFGGYPLSNDNTPAVTWDYLTPNAQFVFRGDLDNGPIQPEGAGVDGRTSNVDGTPGRVIIWGGGEPAASATASAFTFSIAGGVGGGVTSMPAARTGAVTARDNLGRLYSLNGGAQNFRYDAGVSGNGTWTTLAAPPSSFAPTTAAYDGTSRIIVFSGAAVWACNISGNTWSQLANAPISNATSAALGADGFIYVLSGTAVWTFDPVGNAMAQLGATGYSHAGLPAVAGTDGYIYYLGDNTTGTAIERIDARTATVRAPRLTSTPSGTTVVQGTAWTYAMAASGKPRPAFSLVRGPAGMTVDAATGAVLWTPPLAQVGTQTAVVRASNSGGSVEQIITFTVLAVPPDLTPPTVPTGVTVANITTSSADISWSPSTDNIGVTGYRVYEKRRGGTRWRRTTYYAQLAALTGTSWHVGSLAQGATKTYYIAAVDAAGNRSDYASATFTVLSVPSLSADTGGTFQGQRAIVSEPWTGNVYTGYGNPLPALSVVSAPAGAVWHSTAGNTGYFTWTASAGQEGDVVFAIQAANGSGSFTESYHVTVYPAGTDLIPPNPVTGVVVDQVGWDSCRVTWQPTTDNYSVVEYQVTVAHREPRRRFHHGPYNDHVVSFVVPASTTQIIAPALRASTSYAVTVIARDAAGLRSYAWSGSGTSFTTMPQPFAVPNVAQTPNPDGSLTMTWPSYGYYWKFTVQCTDTLATPNWQPVPPASQWPGYVTSFTIVPDPGVGQRFYRILATPGVAP